MRDYELLAQIGQRVRTQRETLDYSREELAEMLGISVNFCSDIELGKKGMSIETISKMSKVLHVSVDYIVNGHAEKTDIAPIIAMLEKCEPSKLEYLKELIKVFMKAVDN